MSKAKRQYHIHKLLKAHSVTDQRVLVDLLQQEGFGATQATVSRDLEEMGALKVRTADGGSAYSIPDEIVSAQSNDEYLRRILSEWLVDIGCSEDLLILRTPPGSASVVASALDRSKLDGLLGTVAGDDTLLVVASKGCGQRLVKQLRTLVGW